MHGGGACGGLRLVFGCARDDGSRDSRPSPLEVSPDLVSMITDAVLETVAEWQNRPLEAMYPLIFFDA